MTYYSLRTTVLCCLFLASYIFSTKINAQAFCQAVGGILFVTNTNDSGNGSLRGAINCANIIPGPQEIQFNIPGDGPHIIFVGSVTGQPLPTLIDDGTVIDGTSQNEFIGAPQIILDGSQTNWNGPFDALHVEGDYCEIYGLTIRYFPNDGIGLENANHTRIGAEGKGNVIYSNGIYQDVFPGFGGLWNGCGIVLRTSSDSCWIQGNFIGTDFTQTLDAGNEYCGIVVQDFCLDTRIGGDSDGEGNIIANHPTGIRIDNSFKNSIRANAMYCNDSVAIELVNNGNFEKAPPTIDVAQVDFISGTAPEGDLVDVFVVDDEECADAPCQGSIYLGTAIADNSIWFFPTNNINYNIQPGEKITATATTIEGTTSTFANCRVAVDGINCAAADGTIWVTNTDDDGPGSLRAAINCANTKVGPNTIKFNIPDSTIQHRIFVGAQTGDELPALIDEKTIIDASTQPGFGVDDFSPKIVLDGGQNNWDIPINAIWIRGDHCEVYGLEIVNFPDDGIDVTDANFAVIGAPNKGNVIFNNGYEMDFFPGLPNTGPWNGCGVVMRSGASFGKVQGNIIGTNYTQDSIAGNEYCGVIVQSNCQGNLIGGSGEGEGNIIAFNELGVRISNTSFGCQIQQNSMFCNEEGIELSGNGNQFQLAPVIDSVAVDTLLGKGVPGDLIEIFVNDTTGCPDLDCQGELFVGTTVVAMDSTWNLSAPFPSGVNIYGGDIITATATDSVNNTSAFSNCLSIPITCNTFVIDIENVQNATCGLMNGSFEVMANGGFEPYLFDFGNGATSEFILDSLSAGTYYVTVTDNSGCEKMDSIEIEEFGAPVLNIEETINESCGQENGSITLSVSGGFPPFLFDLGNGTQNDSVFSNLSAGTYSITLTDAGGCQDSVEVMLENIDGPLLAVANVLNENCDMSDGAFTVIPFGGTPPFQYDIGNGPTGNPNFTGLTNGFYTVVVTDNFGCSNSISVVIFDAPPILASAINIVNATCGLANGSFEILVNGGLAPYTFDIGNGATTSNIFTNLAEGNYQVLVTDLAGCTSTVNVTISDSASPSFSIINILNENCGQVDGSFEILGIGGTPPYSYDIGSGVTSNPVFTNLNAATYNIIITDANGCSENQVFTLGENNIILNVDNVTNASCGLSNGGITVSTSQGTAPYIYNIGNGGTTNPVFDNLPSGNYSISVTDANGCSDNQSVVVLSSDAPVFTVINVMNENCGQVDGGFEISAFGGAPPYSYDIGVGNSTNPIFTNLNAAGYNIIVTDDLGCTASQIFNLPENNVILSIDNVQNTNCGLSDGSITVSASGGTIPYLYDIGNGNTANPIFENLSSGSYNITVTDVFGCQDVQSATVESSNSISMTFIDVQPETCGQMDGAFTVIPTGGTSPYSFDIGNGMTSNNIFTGLSVGSYSVTVTDVNGCQAIDGIAIEGADFPSLLLGDAFNETCNQMNGAISMIGTGGEMPYTYDFGFGASNSNVATNLSAGIYTVTITDNNGCTGDLEVTLLNVGTPTNAGYTYNNNIFTIDFSNTSTDGDNFVWDFGDGNSSTEINPTYTYAMGGTYEVCLIASNSCSSDTLCQMIEVVPPANVVFDLLEVTGEIGDTIRVGVAVENFDNVVSFQKSIQLLDPSIAQFIGVTNLNLTDLTIGDFIINNNTVTVDWGASSSGGYSIADGTVIYELEVRLLFNVGCSDLIFDDNPLPINVVQNINGNNFNAGVDVIAGEVCATSGQGNTVDIAGMIFKENGQNVANVEVTCLTAPNPFFLTNTSGTYEFLDLAQGGDYTVTPFKNDAPANGLTALDLAIIQQHILGMNLLDSPYKIIAADANNSGSISALDIVAIQNVILGNTTSFPNNTSWRFVPEDYVFPNLLDPFSPNFPEEITLNSLGADSLFENFIAIKIGDVNLNSIPSLVGNTNEDLVFAVEYEEVMNSDLVIVHFKLDNREDFVGQGNTLLAWQMDLAFDPSLLSFEEIENSTLSNFNENNIGTNFLNEGILPMVWVNENMLDESDLTTRDDVLFSLRFKAKQTFDFSKKYFKIDKKRSPNLGFQNGRLRDVEIMLHSNMVEQNEKEHFLAVSNYPNPFNEFTNIEFELFEEEEVKIDILDSSGKLIYQLENDFGKGEHSIRIGSSDLPELGLYFYQLQIGEQQYVGKMIYLK